MDAGAGVAAGHRRSTVGLLAWVARETGKTIRFEKPELERKVQTTILHGNIRLLTPLDALGVMLATPTWNMCWPMRIQSSSG